MNKLMNKYLNYMYKNGNILQEEMEIYKFGLECMILKVIHIASYVFIAIMMSEIFELFFILSALIPLRKRAGGYHAKTEAGCYIISCAAVYLGLLFHKLVCNNNIYMMSWIISSFVIFLFAPVDNANKRMNCDEKDYYKKETRTIVLFIGTIVVLSWLIRVEIVAEMLIIGMILVASSLLAEKFNVLMRTDRSHA